MPYITSDDDDGQRLDQVLARLHPAISRTRWQRFIRTHGVELEGVRIHTPNTLVKSHQTILYQEPSPPVRPQLEAYPLKLDILFEDDHVIVINKPAGLVVHPAPGHTKDTLVNALIHHNRHALSPVGLNELRPGIVHRLDKGTSGVMVVAKTEYAHHHLAQQWSEHTVTRRYQALCWGVPHPPLYTLRTFLGRHPVNRQKRAVVHELHGKKAVTHYRVIRSSPPISHVECTLETGRTHQVRVHLHHHGHGLLGDPLYGRTPPLRHDTPLGSALTKLVRDLQERERPALHASHLSFQHPTLEHTMSFETPVPQDLEDILSMMEG